jgi:hypothetical protein
MNNRRYAIPAISALTAGVLFLFIPTPFALYKGDVFLGYAPVSFAYAGVTMSDWPWALWRSIGVILVHWLAMAAVFLAARLAIRRLPN